MLRVEQAPLSPHTTVENAYDRICSFIANTTEPFDADQHATRKAVIKDLRAALDKPSLSLREAYSLVSRVTTFVEKPNNKKGAGRVFKIRPAALELVK